MLHERDSVHYESTQSQKFQLIREFLIALIDILKKKMLCT